MLSVNGRYDLNYDQFDFHQRLPEMSLNFVTGATSTIGRYIVAFLLEKGEKVRIISRRKLASWHENLEVLEGDLREEGVLANCLKDVGRVFHCAAEFHDQGRLWGVNVGVT